MAPHTDTKKVSHKGWIAFIVIVLFALAVPLFIESRYHMHLIIMTCINIALGLSFSLMYKTGLMSIGVAAFWAIGAYASSILVMKLGLSFWLALPLAGFSGALIALATGLVIVRTPGIAFLIQTMVINMIIVQLFGAFEFFGSWSGILDIPAPSIAGNLFVTKVSFYYLIIAILLVCVVAVYALYSSRIGKAWQAIKLNPQLAEALGINLFRYRLLAYVLSSAIAALAGSFYAHYFQSIEPGMFTVFKSIYVQIFSILGGLDFSIVGPAIGAAIMTFGPELLRIGKEIEPILTGTILILLVIFLPGGIMSFPERWSAIRVYLFKEKKATRQRVD